MDLGRARSLNDSGKANGLMTCGPGIGLKFKSQSSMSFERSQSLLNIRVFKVYFRLSQARSGTVSWVLHD